MLDEDTMYRCNLPVYVTLTDARIEPAKTIKSKMPIHKTKSYIELWAAVFPSKLMQWTERKEITYTVIPAVSNKKLAGYMIPKGELCSCSLHIKEMTNA